MTISNRLDNERDFPFITKYKTLSDILTDHDLAALGDAYVNLLFSLVLSKKTGKPIGRKIQSLPLAFALQKTGLRKFLGSRIDRHKQADAAEALIVYGWLIDALSLEESFHIVEKEETIEDGFSSLLETILKKMNDKNL